MSSPRSEKQMHTSEITKIKYTIEELEKLKEDKIIERCREYQSKFHLTTDTFRYPIEYYKAALNIYGLDNIIKEIEHIITLEKERLHKENYYISQYSEAPMNIDDLNVPALGSDNIMS